MLRHILTRSAFCCAGLWLALISGCVKQTSRPVHGTEAQVAATSINDPSNEPATRLKPINLNTATAAELEQLPGVGTVIATRIVEHRARFGAFRRVEHLLSVRGISEGRFAQLRPFITVE